MNTEPRSHYSFAVGLKHGGRGLMAMARQKIHVFLWVNVFATWFIAGGAYMLYLGSTSILPLVCVLTPLVSIPWFVLLISKVGFSRILGLPRAVPWLVAMWIAIQEFLSGAYVGQPEGYYTFLLGFLVLNGIATFIDIDDILRWYLGERAEQFDTGFFLEAS